MDHQYGGGSWMRVPSQNSMAQDPHPLQSQYQQPQQQQQQQHHHHPSLASNFHLLHLLERLADAIESGTRDQHFDALVSEFTAQFERCQRLLNSISVTINTKGVTVEGQKRKLEETMQQLNQRRDLIAKYKSSVEELVKSDNSR
ncbi:mediator of RNA polymerase II transcription subunit 9-like isoform X1 [Phoenix dactylifera]|uniref:Mediator of RNA polymerase II transcription subunit 9-like isoform X1 n=1 Tax=Phoenix dactylifera TaxID=42345 RepID=A0A8B9A684_PHODC|nr:mediator of RNA polymerase II transcription subunit 9-like isoform X1 [Phoenix dactylifera]